MPLASSRSPLVQYGTAILAVAVIAVLRRAFDPWLSGNSPLLPFTIAVVLAACIGAKRAGLLATLLSGLVAEFLFLPQTRPFFLATPEDMLDLAAFLLAGTAMSLLIDRLHVAREHDQSQREILFGNEEKLRLLIDSVHDYGLCLLDAGGHVASWNPGGGRMMGYRDEEIAGRHYCCFFPDATVEAGEPQQDLETAQALGRCERRDWRVRRDGSLVRAHTVLTAVRNDADELRGYALVMREIIPAPAPRSLTGLLEEQRRGLALAIGGRT